MQRVAQILVRQSPAAATQLTRHVSAGMPPASFNPEAYMRFPQFLHDINNKLALHRNTQDTHGVLAKGRLVYTNKCVTVEKEAKILQELCETNRSDLKQLSIACKGLFWQSDIDYTCVPCAFPLHGYFSADKFLSELGLDSPSFKGSVKFEYMSRGMMPKLPIISYQGEDAMNVYKAPLDIISSILGKYDEVYHLTVGQGVINPVLEFIIAKADSDKLIGFMSASVEE